MPKPATAALTTYLNTNNDVIVADLYTILFVDNSSVRIIDYPLASVTIPKTNFPGSPFNYDTSGSWTFSTGPKFGRSKVTTKLGVEATELSMQIFAGTTDLINGGPTWQTWAEAGGFDGAKIELDRFFMPVGGDGIAGPIDTSLGAIVWFFGLVADLEISRSQLMIKVKSMLNILQQQQMPRRLFQSGCTHIYGDVMCGYDRDGGKNALGASTGVGGSTITAIAGSGQWNIIVASGVAAFYGQGSIRGLTGLNAGIVRGILSVGIPTNIGLAKGFPNTVAIGDTFRILPGCDHTANTCNATMLNLLRYGGFDYIPPPELAI